MKGLIGRLVTGSQVVVTFLNSSPERARLFIFGAVV